MGLVKPEPAASWSNSARLALTPEQRAELWFSKIERDVIARGGGFTPVTDLRRKLMRYIKQYNKTAKPFRWALRRSDEAHRMIAIQVVRTVH